MNSNARYFAFIFVSLFVVASQINAVMIEVPVEVNYSDPNNPELKVVNGVKEIDPSCKFAMAPLIVMVGKDGKSFKVVDPDFFNQKFVTENMQAQNRSVFPLPENTDNCSSFFSSENGKNLVIDGVLTTLKGLSKLSAGTIIIAGIIVGKTGKYLAISTYTATSWVCQRLWNRIVDYYERKKFEYDFSRIPELIIPYPSTLAPYPD
ncbi:MAG: hypothetical protein US49_C0003G0039 [candidate division TM6 bacterium GW2011_GWF2_37_49]|nr:MAG: hypothetical protein US49_C0003G0039 [candidate division TM6 bacterium GW2011_GWF2_37_49]